VKEASAVVLFPGGFGTMDECFELLTLMQTGKSAIVPVVLVETGPKPYWRIWDRFVNSALADRRLIDPGDTAFYRIVDGPEAAVREVIDFNRVYHSSRIVGADLIFRLRRPLTTDEVADTQRQFEDILKGPLDQSPGPVPQELDEFPDLPRLIVPFSRSSYSRLRRLIDHVNALGADQAPTPPSVHEAPAEPGLPTN
jgi:putative lysine decarboxylase